MFCIISNSVNIKISLVTLCYCLDVLMKPLGMLHSMSVIIYWYEYVILIDCLNPLFAVTGCPQPNIPAGSYMTREGDRAKIICNNSDSSWFIYCKNNQWTELERKCPQGKI